MDLPFTFILGQFLNVAFWIGGAKMNRSYSIASSPAQRECEYIELAIRREPRGRFTGLANRSYGSSGLSAGATPSAGANYAAPGVINLNSDGNSNTSVTYKSWFAPVMVSGPNGAQSTANYDAFGRPLSGTSVHGAVTNYTYNGAAPFAQSDGPAYVQTAATHGASGTPRWTRTTMDGLGGQ